MHQQQPLRKLDRARCRDTHYDGPPPPSAAENHRHQEAEWHEERNVRGELHDTVRDEGGTVTSKPREHLIERMIDGSVDRRGKERDDRHDRDVCRQGDAQPERATLSLVAHGFWITVAGRPGSA